SPRCRASTASCGRSPPTTGCRSSSPTRPTRSSCPGGRPTRWTNSLSKARQLLALPTGDGLLAARDRAILHFFLFTGARIETGCRLEVADFRQHEEEATIRINEKGNKRRTVGLHFHAANAIQEYIAKAGLKSGPLFRARLNSRSEKLGSKR